MLTVAGGVVLGVLFLFALPFLAVGALYLLEKTLPWIVGGALLFGALAAITWCVEHPDEFVSGVIGVAQLVGVLIVLAVIVCAMALAGSKLPEKPGEPRPE